MKIALSCRSILLEKSLRRFLGEHLVPESDAELIVTDHPLQSEKPVLRIGTDSGADLGKPFSKSRLMIKIEEKLQAGRTREAFNHDRGGESGGADRESGAGVYPGVDQNIQRAL